MTRLVRFLAVPLAACLIGLSSACAGIPSAAPELSARLTGRLHETRTAHVTLVRRYFDEKRAAVDRFLIDEWIPTFARTLFETPEVDAAWQAVVETRDLNERLQFVVGFGSRLQTRINQRRLDLVRPLDEAERTILRKLDEHYNQMIAMNATLTGLLEASARATANQERLLRVVDPGARLPEYIDKANEITSLLVEHTDSLERNWPKIENLLDQLKALR